MQSIKKNKISHRDKSFLGEVRSAETSLSEGNCQVRARAEKISWIRRPRGIFMAMWAGHMDRNQEEAQMLANSPYPLSHSHGIAEFMVCRKLG